MLTDSQRKKLSELLMHALVAIRYLGWDGHAQQAADLADAMHNAPLGMWSSDFSLKWLRNDLERYHHKYPGNGETFIAMIDEIIATSD